MAKAGGIRAGRAYVEAGLNDAGLQAGLKAAEAKVKGFGAGLASVGGVVAGLGVAITTPFLGAAKAFADTGSALNDMSERTGLSVEVLSALSHAAAQTGTDMQAVEKAVRFTQRTIVDATKGNVEAEASFNALGLSAFKLAKLRPDQQFQAVAAAMAKIPNPTLKAAMAMKLLGKGNTAVIPLIDDLSALTAEAKKLGLVMSGSDAKAADALGDSIDNVTAVVKSAAIAVGSALAPELTALAKSLTEAAVAAISWLKANRPLVVMAFKVGVAITAVGAALVGVGATIYAGGAALGVLATALTTAGAVVAALLSPLGLLAAGLAVGAVWFFKFSEAGGQALAWLGEQFKGLQKTTTEAFAGIANALKAGDIALAGKILWAGLKVEWLKGVAYLQGVWADWGVAVVEVFTGVQYTLAGIWLDLVDGFRSVFASLTAQLSGSWGDLIKSFIMALSPLASALEALGFDVGGLVDKGLNAVGLTTGEAEKKRQESLAKIGQQNIDAHSALDQQKAMDSASRRQAADSGLQAARKAVADAQVEFDALNKLAAKKAGALEGGGPAKGLGPDLSTLGPDMKKAKAKIDVAGTFNAAGVAGLGVGTSLGESQLKEAKKHTEQLEKANRKLDRVKGAFT